jgi:hypothetical protein
MGARSSFSFIAWSVAAFVGISTRGSLVVDPAMPIGPFKVDLRVALAPMDGFAGNRQWPQTSHAHSSFAFKLFKLPRDQLLFRRRALGLLSLPRHFPDQNWLLEEWP